MRIKVLKLDVTDMRKEGGIDWISLGMKRKKLASLKRTSSIMCNE